MLLFADNPGQINALADENGNGKYYKLKTVVDTGATSSVLPPDECPDIPIEDSPGSLNGQTFTSASGGVMKNQGQKRFAFVSNEWDRLGMKYNVADMQQGSTSVGEICDEGDGNTFVVFTKYGGYIGSPQLGTTTGFDRAGTGAPYLMTQWVEKPGFHRPGQ